MELVRQANTPGWWHRYSDVLPGWFEMYVRLEQAASTIHSYQVQFVPGLFQTEEYARAVIAADAVGDPPHETERRVTPADDAAEAADRAGLPAVPGVLDEAALRRTYGSDAGDARAAGAPRSARRPAERHAAGAAVRPRRRAAAAGPFTMLQFAEDDLPDIVYMEQLTSAVYLDKRTEVELYRTAMDRIAAAALTPAESRTLLADQAAQLR